MLEAVGEILEADGNPQGIVIVGGADLNLRGWVSRTTRDVDVIARTERAEEGFALFPPDPFPAPLEEAIARVARDFGLPATWMNAEIGAQWLQGIPVWLSDDLEWRQYGASTSPSSSNRWSPMSNEILREIDRVATDAAVGCCWRQWQELSGSVTTTSAHRARAIIDLEALLLLSLSVLEHERRLQDMIHWWASVGSRLMSVQRLSTLADRFSKQAQGRMAMFAESAVREGDRRWRRYLQDDSTTSERRVKGPPEPFLFESSALMARLRAGFGVGVKADALCFLIGMRELPAPVRLIARAIGYSEPSVYAATREMAWARLIHRVDDAPIAYVAYPRFWKEWLGSEPASQGEPSALPAWRFQAQVYGFLSRAIQWSGSPVSSDSPYLLASAARDLYEQHREAFDLNRIQVPDPEEYRGAEYLEAFRRTIRIMADWLEAEI